MALVAVLEASQLSYLVDKLGDAVTLEALQTSLAEGRPKLLSLLKDFGLGLADRQKLATALRHLACRPAWLTAPCCADTRYVAPYSTLWAAWSSGVMSPVRIGTIGM